MTLIKYFFGMVNSVKTLQVKERNATICALLILWFVFQRYKTVEIYILKGFGKIIYALEILVRVLKFSTGITH